MSPGKRAVVFDFDGVIADNFHLHEKCWQELLGPRKAELTDELMARAIGWSSRDTAKLLVEELVLPVDPVGLGKQKDDLFAKRLGPEQHLMEGAAQALTRLGDEFTIAIASLRRPEHVTDILKQYDLSGVPKAIVTIYDLDPEQEIEDLFAMAANQLEVLPEHAVLIDDARNGILAAKRLGMKTIAFDSNPKYEIDYSMADAQVKSLDELLPELINQVIAA